MNKLKRILCAMLCVCMISIPMAIPTTVSAEDSISDLEQQLQQLEQENEKYQKILDDTKSDIAEKEEYKSALVSKVQVLDEKIAVTREKISSLNDDIKEKQDAYDKGLSEVEDQFDALANRLRILYMSGNATDLEIIFGAKDFSDLIDKMELVKSLANSDKELISEIQTKLDELSTKKKSLEADKKDLETQQASLKSSLINSFPIMTRFLKIFTHQIPRRRIPWKVRLCRVMRLKLKSASTMPLKRLLRNTLLRLHRAQAVHQAALQAVHQAAQAVRVHQAQVHHL